MAIVAKSGLRTYAIARRMLHGGFGRCFGIVLDTNSSGDEAIPIGLGAGLGGPSETRVLRYLFSCTCSRVTKLVTSAPVAPTFGTTGPEGSGGGGLKEVRFVSDADCRPGRF